MPGRYIYRDQFALALESNSDPATPRSDASSPAFSARPSFSILSARLKIPQFSSNFRDAISAVFLITVAICNVLVYVNLGSCAPDSESAPDI
jgi:hypothetical protein